MTRSFAALTHSYIATVTLVFQGGKGVSGSKRVPSGSGTKTGLHRIQGRHKAFTGSVCNTRLSQDPPPPQGPHKIQTQTWNLSRSTIPPDPPRDPFCQMRGPVEIQVVTKVQYRSRPQTGSHQDPVHPSRQTFSFFHLPMTPLLFFSIYQ